MGHGVTGIPPDSGSGESRFKSWWPSTAVDVGHGAGGPCGCSSAGRAPPCQGGGRGVEARHPLARLAQLAERCCDTAEVVGSIPSARTSLAPRCEAQPPPRWGARPCSPNGRGVRFRTGRLGVRLPPGAHTPRTTRGTGAFTAAAVEAPRVHGATGSAGALQASGSGFESPWIHDGGHCLIRGGPSGGA